METEKIQDEIDRAEYERIPIDELVPWEKNPRTNMDEGSDRLQRTIGAVGWGADVLVQKSTRRVIGGHLRLRAARKLGIDRIPCKVLDVDDDRATEIALSDNQASGFAQWEPVGLAELLEERDPTRRSVLGWEPGDYRAVVRDMNAAIAGSMGTTEDNVPEPPSEPVTKFGDVWTLGRHALVCGDSVDVCRGLPPFGMLVTDPPYGVSAVRSGMVGADFGVAKKGSYEPIAGDGEVPDVSWLVSRGDLTKVIWGGNYFAPQLPATGSWLVWDKRESSGIVNTFADCELAWSDRGGPARVHRQLWNGMIRAGEHSKRVHPTQKPVALMMWCMSFGDGSVLDPFAGSGTTLIACEHLNRTCHAVELSPAYCDAIVERWQNLTGGKATRSNP